MQGSEDFIKQVDKLVARDHLYRQILTDLQKEEQDYLRIMKGLSLQDQEGIERYITLYEDLEYQKVRIAYRYGRMRIA